MRTRLRQLWCAINGHPNRETITEYDELRGVTWTKRRQTCLGCGKRLT